MAEPALLSDLSPYCAALSRHGVTMGLYLLIMMVRRALLVYAASASDPHPIPATPYPQRALLLVEMLVPMGEYPSLELGK